MARDYLLISLHGIDGFFCLDLRVGNGNDKACMFHIN